MRSGPGEKSLLPGGHPSLNSSLQTCWVGGGGAGRGERPDPCFKESSLLPTALRRDPDARPCWLGPRGEQKPGDSQTPAFALLSRGRLNKEALENVPQWVRLEREGADGCVPDSPSPRC